MANPSVVVITKGQWVPVAINVFSGTINRLNTKPDIYLQTYRLTGEAAPTLETEGAILFEEFSAEPIESPDGIDVYVWAKGFDGKVRADL